MEKVCRINRKDIYMVCDGDGEPTRFVVLGCVFRSIGAAITFAKIAK